MISREFSNLQSSLKPRDAAELEFIAKDPNAEMREFQLTRFTQSLEARGELAAAATVKAVFPTIKSVSGPEKWLSDWNRTLFDGKGLVAFAAASALGEFARIAVLARLKTGGKYLLTQRALGAAAGMAVELPALAVVGRTFGLSHDWSDLAASMLTLRLASGLGTLSGSSLLQGGATLAGLMVLVKAQSQPGGAPTIFELGALLLQGKIASHLTAKYFAKPLGRLHADLDARRSITQKLTPPWLSGRAFAPAGTGQWVTQAAHSPSAPPSNSLAMSALSENQLAPLRERLQRVQSEVPNTKPENLPAQMQEIRYLEQISAADLGDFFIILKEMKMFYVRNGRRLPQGYFDFAKRLEASALDTVKTERLYSLFLRSGAGDVAYLDFPSDLKLPSVLKLHGDYANQDSISVNIMPAGSIWPPQYYRLANMKLFQDIVSDKKLEKFRRLIVQNEPIAPVVMARSKDDPFLYDGYHRALAAHLEKATHILGSLTRDRILPFGSPQTFDTIQIRPDEEVAERIKQNRAQDGLMKDAPSYHNFLEE